jgi:hypothetical protein
MFSINIKTAGIYDTREVMFPFMVKTVYLLRLQIQPWWDAFTAAQKREYNIAA